MVESFLPETYGGKAENFSEYKDDKYHKVNYFAYLPELNKTNAENTHEDVRSELEFFKAARIDDVLEAALEKEQTVPKGENYVIQEVEPRQDGARERLIAKEK